MRYEIEQIYQEELPAIIPNYKVGPMKEPQELNTSPLVSRKKRFLTDIIGLGIQAFSAISQHRKQTKLEKSMKHLKHRQDALDHKIEALEDDMISITKETFEERARRSKFHDPHLNRKKQTWICIVSLILYLKRQP